MTRRNGSVPGSAYGGESSAGHAKDKPLTVVIGGPAFAATSATEGSAAHACGPPTATTATASHTHTANVRPTPDQPGSNAHATPATSSVRARTIRSEPQR